MSTTPERLTQGVEELRGDYEEMGDRVITPAVAVGASQIFPAFLDGRLANIPAASYSGAGGRGDVGGLMRRIQAIPGTAITGIATNNATINVRRMNAGVNQGTLYTVTFAAATNWTLEQIVDLGVNNVQLNPGDLIDVQVVQNGTGMALPPILWVFEYTRLGV